jgi:hypothetical protein
MKPGVSSMIPRQMTKHGMVFAKLSPRHKKFRFKKSKNKVMLATFFDSQGIIHKAFVPPGHMVHMEYYVEGLSSSVQRIYQIRPQFRERGSWFLLDDNARPHPAASIKQFLVKQGIP